MSPKSRRRLLKIIAAVPAAVIGGRFAGLPSPLAAAAEGRGVAGYDPALVPDAETLARWLRQLHDFGPIRMTGTPQSRAFEEWLARECAALGFAIERDQFRLTSWECRVTDCSAVVTEDGGGKKTLDVVSYYPFGGSTRGKDPVTGRVLRVPGIGPQAAKAFAESLDAQALAEAIVVMDMPLLRTNANPGQRAATGLYPERFPAVAPARVGGPSPAGQSGREIMELFEHRCRGLILCFTDVSNDAARHTYLPFSDQHRSLPALWLGADSSRYLQSVSGKATLTMRCDARLTPDSRADTIVATMKGQSDEVIFLTTQTDGPNEVNENGPLGILALATFWAKLPAIVRRRTLVCSLPTGHYAAGAIADPVSGSGRRAGTRGVIEKWPGLVPKIVGQISLEQMGAMEWSDVNGEYAATGNVAVERWIPTPASAAAARQMVQAAWNGEDPRFSNAVLVAAGGAPGEGGSLRALDLPGVGLMGQPSYFFRADPAGVLEKINPLVMRNQIAIAAKLVVLMNRLTREQLAAKAPIADADLYGDVISRG